MSSNSSNSHRHLQGRFTAPLLALLDTGVEIVLALSPLLVRGLQMPTGCTMYGLQMMGQPNQRRGGDGYRITAKESEDNSTKLEVCIAESSEPTGWLKFGELKIGSTFEREDSPLRYVWFRIDNRALYLPFYPDIPVANHVYFIAEDLGLKFNNITRLDIAVDSNVNFPKRIVKAVRNKAYTPIVLGKSYPEEREIIPKLLYIHTGDRKRYRSLSISVSAQEKDFALCAYDKGEEIETSGKDYISQKNGMADMYRVEARLKRAALADYLQKSGGCSMEWLYPRIFDRALQLEMALHFLNRLLRFRTDTGLRSVLEI